MREFVFKGKSYPRGPLLLRLIKLTIVKPDGCWEWQGRDNQQGYGQISIGPPPRNVVVAHRVMYELLRGPIPDGLFLDHLCRNRGCINPSHLEPVTPLENTRRGHSGKWWREKTHCVNGHAYEPDNLVLRTKKRRSIGGKGEVFTSRICKICLDASTLRTRERIKERNKRERLQANLSAAIDLIERGRK